MCSTPAFAQVAGTDVDDVTGTSVEGAIVTMQATDMQATDMQATDMRTTTDAAGVYSLPMCQQGT